MALTPDIPAPPGLRIEESFDGDLIRILWSEVAGIGALVIAPGGRIHYLNKRLLELWDLPEPTIVEGNGETLLAAMRARIRIGELPGTGRRVLFLDDGRVLRRRTHAILSPGGIPLTAMLFDETIIAGELQGAFDQIPDAISVWDDGGRPIFMNRAFDELFPLGSPWRRAHRPRLAPTEEVRLQDGRWLEFSAWDSGPDRVVCLCRDITAAKRSTVADTASSALWKATLDHLDQGVAVFDVDARLVVLNRRFLELIDLPLELARAGTTLEAIVRRIAMRGGYGPGAPESLATAYLALTREGEPHTLEPMRANGPILDMRGTALPDGGFVLSATDVSLHKRAETVARLAQSQAEASSRMKSDFLATMSHELRTPLNAILGFSELMRQQAGGALAEPYRRYAGDIYESGAHLLDLINDILDLSKIEAGRLDLHLEPVDIRRIFATTKTLLESRAAHGGVELVVECPEAFPTVHADPLRLKQIILNLVTNAIRFSHSRSRVTLAVRQASGGFELVVSDQGIGMSDEELAIALEPFGQVSGSIARRHEGVGLGLPLAQRFVALHGGRMQIKSAKGVGTTVCVFIPDARADESA
jgi:signal transduction histidine kinase